MNLFSRLIEKFRSLFIWWVIITPWEQVLRVRLGKHLKLLEEGIHLKIPGIDYIFRQSTRMRVGLLPTQTLTTEDNKTLTIRGMIVYSIADLELLYCCGYNYWSRCPSDS